MPAGESLTGRKENAMKRKYSGPLSRAFWREVDRVKSHVQRDAIYAMAVALQNLEGSVLRELESATKIR
jgi:hypothetical protein